LFVSCASLFWYWTFNVLSYRTSLLLDYKGRFPPSPPEDAAYWPDTQGTPPAKEGTNGIWPEISQFFEDSWVLLPAPKLGHGTDCFTSPPKEGMLWIFPAGKIRRLRSGANPRSWVPEASMLITRPPKRIRSPDRPASSQSLYRLSYRPTFHDKHLDNYGCWFPDRRLLSPRQLAA
jgi:hypothetical protein